MPKYKKGKLNNLLLPSPLNSQYNLNVKQKEWIIPQRFLDYFVGFNVWSCRGEFYYSTQYIGHCKLSGNTWVEHTWGGYNNFSAGDIWESDGEYYLSMYRDGEYRNFRLNGNTWETHEFSIPELRAGYVWKDSSSTYATIGGVTYTYSPLNKDFYLSPFTAYNKANPPAAGSSLWSDGNRIFHDNFVFDEVIDEFVPFNWNTDFFTKYPYPTIKNCGNNIILFGNPTELFLNNDTSILVGDKILPYKFNLPDDVEIGNISSSVWCDGTNVYLMYYDGEGRSFSYVIEPATTTEFEHELPSTANTVTINLYMNNSEKNVIGKSLTSVRNLNGTFKQEADIVNLSIQVDLSTVPNFNYLRVPLFNRYYFVDNIVNIRDDLWEISCHVDVLESFKDTIMSTYGFIERNEFEFNPKIIDHLRVIEQGVTTEVLTGGMTLETVLNAGVPQTMTETSPRFMLVGTFISLEGELT